MLKTLIIFFVISLVLTVITVLIPEQITATINNSITYFLSFINYLNPIVNVSTIFIALKILSNFIFYSLLYIMIISIMKIVSG